MNKPLLQLSSPKPVTQRLLWPLTLTLSLLVAGLVLALLVLQSELLQQTNRGMQRETASGFDRQVIKQATFLRLVMGSLVAVEGLSEMILADDRIALRDRFAATYNLLADGNQISHWYFHRADRTNLLRLHQPERFDDLIGRATLAESLRSQDTVSGVELGVLGTLTLRVVAPLRSDDVVVGYLELGMEVEDILPDLISAQDAEFMVIVNKQFLEQQPWESGMAMLGRPAIWNLFEDFVTIFSSIPEGSAIVSSAVKELNDFKLDTSLTVEADQIKWSLFATPLIDFSGVQIGNLVVLRNITAATATLNRILALTFVSFSVLVGCLLFGLYRMLRNTDQILFHQQQELVRAFDLFRNVVENSEDLICVKDNQHRVMLCNSSYAKFIGKNPDDLVGETGIHLGQQDEEDDEKRVLEGEGNTIHRPDESIEIDGQIHRYDILRSPLRSTEGEIIGVLCVARDITRAMLDQDTAKRAKRMEAITQLTGGIAHDFNNILAIVQANAELLELKLSNDPDAMKLVQSVKQTTERGATLTKQLLTVTRNRATVKDSVNISNLVFNIKNLIDSSITPQVQIHYNLAVSLWNTEMDAGDFQDAIINLVINARDAMNGAGTLTITTQNISAKSDCVEIVVQDTGCGIDEENMDRIFDPFFTTKPTGDGNGLGLTMVYAFVKRSDGKIEVKSKSDAGTTFSLIFPRTSVRKQFENNQNGDSQIPIKVPGGSETILLVDDEKDLRETTRKLLESLGYTALTANSAQQALDILSDDASIDLLLTDVVMPGAMNGYELTMRACEQRPELRVLISSGYSEGVNLSKEHEKFVDNHIDKPYQLKDLAEKIRFIFDSDSQTNSKFIDQNATY